MSIINQNILLFPHLEWNREFENEDTLYNYIHKITNYFDLNITVWTKNSFTLNDEGYWNVVISVEVDEFSYHYMFRYNYNLKILYGCPCKNITKYDHTCLSTKENPSLFNIFQSGLIKVID